VSEPVTGKQLIPPDITGKGSGGTGSGASVLDHAFGTSDPYTLGVEEEYQLLDGRTFDLVQHIDTVLAAIAGHELEAQINPELMQSVLEIATPVCHTPADVMAELTKLRGYVCSVARATGMRLGSAGTHPFSLFERQRITAKDRYRQLVDQLQYIARRELIFGMHIHVAIDAPDKAIKVMNGLLPQLAPLLALSASSPFWRGEPTGLMSSRQMVFSSFPRSGPPPRFRDYADYAEVVGQLERTGCIADYTHIWWDIRPHPRLGTIEIRICDAVTRVEDAVAITAYCQALVKQLSEQHDAGEEIASYHRILTTENKWLAARYGLEAPVMDLATGRRNRIPVAQLVRRTVREIEPHARELGSERELEGIGELLARGNSADRQLRIFNANRDIREVVEEIAIATETLPVVAA
jgi:carboxylate-amine ligase